MYGVEAAGRGLDTEEHAASLNRGRPGVLHGNRTYLLQDAHGQISVLQTEWEHVAGPARIQELAERQLGMSDTTSVRLSSFEQLPRRG